jgi:hypothetical protein
VCETDTTLVRFCTVFRKIVYAPSFGLYKSIRESDPVSVFDVATSVHYKCVQMYVSVFDVATSVHYKCV